MAKKSWSGVIDMTSDAGFRAWGLEVNDALGDIGLVQTSDTGQINWTTVTRAAINTAAGYEIWRFDDSLQGSFPLYFKLEYGSGAATTRPSLWLTVGTGSNGSGTITGTTSTRTQINSTSATIASTVTSYPSYACSKDGFAWLNFKVGSITSGGNILCAGGFFIQRYNDADATPNGKGFVVYTWPPNSNSIAPPIAQSVRTASTAIVFATNSEGLFTIMPHGDSTTTVDENGDMQIYGHWAPTRQAMQLFAACTHSAGEVAPAGTFSATIMGASARTWITTSSNAGSANGSPLGGPGAAAGNSRIALIWED